MRRSVLVLIWFLLACRLSLAPAAPGGAKKVRPPLEEAFRLWLKGTASAEKADREKAIRSMLPTKKDYDLLFSEHAKELWSRHEKFIKDVYEKADETARMISKGGALTNFTELDIRKAEGLPERYKWVIGVIPKEVPAADCVYELKNGKGKIGTFFYVHGRWILIRDLDGFEP